MIIYGLNLSGAKKIYKWRAVVDTEMNLGFQKIFGIYLLAE